MALRGKTCHSVDGGGLAGAALTERAPVASCWCIFEYSTSIALSLHCGKKEIDKELEACKHILSFALHRFLRNECKNECTAQVSQPKIALSTEVGACSLTRLGPKAQIPQPFGKVRRREEEGGE